MANLGTAKSSGTVRLNRPLDIDVRFLLILVENFHIFTSFQFGFLPAAKPAENFSLIGSLTIGKPVRLTFLFFAL
jgi:hypothetical protein